MSEKVQYMALVDPSTRDRLDALRIVMRESRARIGEMAWLGGGLPALEAENAVRLERLRVVATRARNISDYAWWDYVREFATRYARTYGPTLEELEKDPRLGLKLKAAKATAPAA